MAVVNSEVGDQGQGDNTDAERPPQQESDEAERRIRGESDGGLNQPPEGGHARVDLPFPTAFWNDNLLCQKQQQQLSISTITSIMPQLLTRSPAQPEQLKHCQNHSNNSSSIKSSSISISSSSRRPRTTFVTSTLPSAKSRYHRHQSSPHHLPHQTNSTSTTAATTIHTIPASPILVAKKSILGHSYRVTKKYRCSRMRRVKRQEYKKLRQMVPALQEKNKVSKVVVIEEAIKYIDELHSALVQRFKSRDIPTTFNGVHLDPKEVHGGNIRELIRRLLANANPNSLPPAKIENVRTLPSFLQKLGRHKKS